jgi:hypothetical protein
VALKLLPDLGAPLAVTAVDLATEAMVPNYNEWIVYGLTVLGYVGGWLGWGGEFMKNVGIASLPLAAKKVYSRVRGATGASSRLTMRRVAVPVGRYPTEPFQPAFSGGARLV